METRFLSQRCSIFAVVKHLCCNKMAKTLLQDGWGCGEGERVMPE